MVRVSVPLPDTTWRGLRRMAEDRRVTGRASLSALIAQILDRALAEQDGKGRGLA
jgi:predicted DNA-binding ribbon-helix-helix protein